MALTGTEFNAEKGSKGFLLQWMWSKIFPKINAIIPEQITPDTQFSGSSFHYHAAFGFFSGNARIWDIVCYSSTNVANMATQIVGIDTNPVTFSVNINRSTHNEYRRGVSFNQGESYFIRFFELQNGQYVQVYVLKFISF